MYEDSEDYQQPKSLVRQDDVIHHRSGETSMTAASAQVKAMVESRLTVANHLGRNWPQIRNSVLKLCKDPEFASEALYTKPVGGDIPDGFSTMSKRDQLLSAPAKWPRGLSIRFIEAALAEAGHYDTPTVVLWEDEEKRITQVTVWDLVKNNAYHRTIVISKTTEKRKLRTDKKGNILQPYISSRINSYGETVYIVPATNDEVDTREAALVSKAIRTLGERLLPAGLKREWETECERTIRNQDAIDPEAKMKTLLDGFNGVGVQPVDIEEFLGHSVTSIQPAEITKLRGIFVAITNGVAVWADVLSLVRAERENDPNYKPTTAEVKLAESIRSARERTPNPPAETAEQSAARKAAQMAEQSTQGQQSGPAPTSAPRPTEAPKPTTSTMGETTTSTTPWKDQAGMLSAFEKLREAGGEDKFFRALGSNGIENTSQLVVDSPATIKAYDDLLDAVTPPKPTTAPAPPAASVPKFGQRPAPKR